MKHTLQIMSDTEGDRLMEYDPAVKEEVLGARTAFEEALKQGHTGFDVGPAGKTRVVRKFSPDIERIVTAPPIAGG